MNNSMLRVLFLCTGNSCRSIMAEAILNHLGKGRIKGSSAGSRPAGFVHPQALACLERNGVPVSRPCSKSWVELADTAPDLVVTVCDRAAGESCPLFPGNPPKVHWGLPDPALATGSDAEVAEAFQSVFDALHAHLQAFVETSGDDFEVGFADAAERVGAP
ncbi:MAG: arsenate reductase ArsC [Gammaproteobacteria bacterium]|nr:arsenate reductase ArsC [Gammaproteobacteria bacterium]